MHPNLHNYDGVRAMLGPSVEAHGTAVKVGNAFGATALTDKEWADLAAERGDKPYVLVDYGLGPVPYVSPLRTYAEAMAEFAQDIRSGWHGDYSPDSGRRLVVMSQADYLEASKHWRQS